MCGILFSLSASGDPPSPHHVSIISQRGPDSTRTHVVTIGSQTLNFTSSLLSVRGTEPTPQPLVDQSSGSVLCWNGEAWRIRGESLAEGANDTREVFDLLLNAPNGRLDEVLHQLDGEFAFVYYDAPAGVFWYGRDWAGRRSLVSRKTESALEVASVGDGQGSPWEEVEAGGVWRFEVAGGNAEWLTTRASGEPIYNVPSLNLELPDETNDTPLTIDSPVVDSLHDALLESLRLRVRDIQLPPDHDLQARHLPKDAEGNDVRIAILFSGGVDCTTLARIAHEVLPPDEPVDLLNVTFENPRVVAARNKPPPKPPKAKKSKHPKNNSEEAPVGEEIRTEEVISSAVTESDPYAICPDRGTGLSSFEDLKTSCPTRRWRFVPINIPYADVLAHRANVINLMHPHNTEMDLSIALAFYFAARGQADNYITPARILLSGLGADELLGGYTRHATAHRRGGYPALLEELNLDFQRLGKRNLGRDDRVGTNWAKEMRYPFLDEKVVAWAMAAPVTSKCPFGSEPGATENGKKVLRLLAQKLGLPKAAGEAKRAVQFGARTAKMSIESRKMKGTDGLCP